MPRVLRVEHIEATHEREHECTPQRRQIRPPLRESGEATMEIGWDACAEKNRA